MAVLEIGISGRSERLPGMARKLRVEYSGAVYDPLEVRQVADIQTQKMLKLPVPELRIGKPIVVSAPSSRKLKEIVQPLVARAEALRSGRIDPREDNMLLVTTDGRKAALDLRLHDPRLPDHPNTKVNLAVAQERTTLNGELAASAALSGAVQSPR